MADVHNGDALGAQFVHDGEQRFDLRRSQRRSGLVQDQHPAVCRDGFCDLDQLHLRNAQGSQFRLGVKVQMNFFQHLGGIGVHFFVVDHCNRADFFGGIAAHINILANAALGDGLELLMHHGNAAVQCVQRAFDLDFFSLVNDFSFIHMIDAEHTFHQGRFACAVLAHQSVNSAGPQLQLRVVQRLYAGKGFDDATHFQTIIRQIRFPPSLKVKGVRAPAHTHPRFAFMLWDYLNSATFCGVTLT